MNMKKVIKRVPCKLVCKWPNVNILSKQAIITILLVIIAMTGQAQTKTATVTGYSPALKDGTLVFAGTDSPIPVVDTVQAGRFAYTLPVEKFTESYLSFMGEGCPNSHTLIFLRPGVTVKVTGSDCFNPLWKVDSPIPEQQTQNRLTEYCRDVLTERMRMDLAKESHEKRDSVTMKWMKQQMDILPSLPVDAATVRALLGISETATYTKDFPYMEQLKEVEKTIAARAPKGFEEKLAEILRRTRKTCVGLWTPMMQNPSTCKDRIIYIHHASFMWVRKLWIPSSSICKGRNTICSKLLPMENMYCSISGTSVADRAESPNRR